MEYYQYRNRTRYERRLHRRSQTPGEPNAELAAWRKRRANGAGVDGGADCVCKVGGEGWTVDGRVA